MLGNIKTSKENKAIVVALTNKLTLGTENIISRIAFAHSLASGRLLELKNIKDFGGKEYSEKVLFGEFTSYYIAMICIQYNIYSSDKDVARYIKMHIDDGLQLLNEEFETKRNTTGFEFIATKIEEGLMFIQ
jgi:DNA sulfur modification protein DndE